MPTYEVTVNVMYREIYVIEADNAAEAEKNWAEGDLVVAEAEYVDDISNVVETED